MTTDNGANMLASAKVLANDSISDDLVDLTNLDSEDYGESDLENDDCDNDDFISLSVALCNSPLLRNIRCAAHTVQLAIRDFLKTVKLLILYQKRD